MPGVGRGRVRVMSVLDLRPRKFGSFEEYTVTLSRALARRGWESVLVFKELPPGSLRPCYEEAGAILDVKPFAPFGWRSARALDELIEQRHPDLVHFHFVNLLSLDVVAAGRRHGVKLILSDHSSTPVGKRQAIHQLLLRGGRRVFSAFVDRFVTPSDYVHRRLVRDGLNPAKISTVHNGVNLTRFRPAAAEDVRARYGIGPQSLLVVSICQLIPEKGIGYLIEAAAKLLGQGFDVSFIHLGDGPCAAEYRARLRSLGIEPRFVFAGVVDLPEVAAILRECDIFTLPCTWGEAFSLAVLEAMAAGKPAVVTGVGGNIEAVEHGRNGLVIPPNDVEALSTAIRTLHDNPTLRATMGEDALAQSARFSVDRWVDDTLRLYDTLLEKG
jgi:glycosyltransferase involved in cell wall biosynthesis